LRGPAMNALATKRFEGIDSAKPPNVELKSVKVQATAESSYHAVRSWLGFATVRPEGTQMIVSQNADFILGAKKAFETDTSPADRPKWLGLPCAGAGVPSQVKPLVDQGVFRAAVMTPLTMDTAIDMLVRAIKEGTQPQEKTFIEAHSHPSLEDLVRNGS
jgi:hypothetical protein